MTSFEQAPVTTNHRWRDDPPDQPLTQVFLAYADEDLSLPLGRTSTSAIEAVRQLLLGAGFSVWDRHCHGSAATDLETAVSRATEACDNYIFLLSANAIHNALCLQGLLFALSMNKRIVPILLHSIDVEHLPDPLRTMTWLDLRQASPTLASSAEGQQLLTTLRADATYHHTHTRLLVQALQWERQQRHPSGLLPKAAIHRYRRWLKAAQARQQYRPIYLQELFLAESIRQAEGKTPATWQPQAPAEGFAQVTHWLRQWIGG